MTRWWRRLMIRIGISEDLPRGVLDMPATARIPAAMVDAVPMAEDMQPELPIYRACPCEVCVYNRAREAELLPYTGHGLPKGLN